MPRVGRVAYARGFAGLLPALAAACLIALGRAETVVIAFAYPAIILSFLGGIWWGFAMRRETRQARLAALAITPSLIALALPLVASVGSVASDDPYRSGLWTSWSMVALGVALFLTLLVDRHLVATGEAPEGWMRLRVPLSIGLGGLTIVSAALFDAAVRQI